MIPKRCLAWVISAGMLLKYRSIQLSFIYIMYARGEGARLGLLAEVEGLGSEPCGELGVGAGEGGDLGGGDWVADGDAEGCVVFAEDFGGESECAELPAEDAEEAEGEGVVAVEVDGDYGDVELADESGDGFAPGVFFESEVAVVVADGACGEESYGVAGADLADGVFDAFEGDASFGGVVASALVDGDEVGAHGCDVVEEHVDHDFEFGSAGADEVDEGDSVECAEGVVADGDEWSLGEVVEELGVVDL